MDIRVNDILWHIQFKKPISSELKRSDGTISLGVTDNTTKTVTIADNVSDYMADKILCHELVHVYYVLYLHHGFGNKRIVRLERTINEYLERAQTEKEMKTETLAELLKVRYGIDVQKEINLIPMQQLIRIYQRNNPLTINDTRQLLNDTAYSYMVLACTALKLMFKLSVREIEEFIAEFRDLIDTLYKFNQFGLTLPKVAQCLADEVNYVDERYIKVID